MSARIRRRSPLSLRFEDDGSLTIEASGKRLAFPPQALRLLEAFSRETTLEEGLRAAGAGSGGLHAYLDLLGTARTLLEEGVLVQEGEGGASSPRAMAGGFDAPPVHVAMLDDRARTEAFLRAIEAAVRPGDVVVDIGTGTGVLALAAARRGARQVYAIEASPGIAEAARGVFRANGLDERVTLLPGYSTEVVLPEPADVVVAEIIGNDPLDERILETLDDAARRLARPGARFVPAGLSLRAQPVELPPSVRRRLTFTAAAARRWRRWYGLDLTSLVDPRRERSRPERVDLKRARAWKKLAAPGQLSERGFGTPAAAELFGAHAFEIERAGTLDGILLFPEIRFHGAPALALDPAAVTAGNHWSGTLWLLPERRVDALEKVVVELSHEGGTSTVRVRR